ncbi:hypothetical protein PC112_g6627 [Phytophthora cactorum]|nr:hypothetical protein PC112_g6627 [Phytophthora cactorum]
MPLSPLPQKSRQRPNKTSARSRHERREQHTKQQRRQTPSATQRSLLIPQLWISSKLGEGTLAHQTESSRLIVSCSLCASI